MQAIRRIKSALPGISGRHLPVDRPEHADLVPAPERGEQLALVAVPGDALDHGLLRQQLELPDHDVDIRVDVYKRQTQISTVSGITLVTLQGSPATTAFMADVFERIAKLNVNIDMISMPPNHGANAGLSFTISDQDLIDVLSLVNSLKTETGIKVIVSSVNHKISVYDPQMKNTPGMAARVFSAIASSDADIRLITTSEVEISFLVTEADYDTVLKAIENAVNAAE